MTENIPELIDGLRQAEVADRYIGSRKSLSLLLGRAADALEALTAEGACWNEGPTLPVRAGDCGPLPPRCELRAGHAGAHSNGRMQWMTRDAHNTLLAQIEALTTERDDANAGYRAVVERLSEVSALGVRCDEDRAVAVARVSVLEEEIATLTAERDDLLASLDARWEHSDHSAAKYYRRMRSAEREMHARELHHFEEEQKSAALAARVSVLEETIREAHALLRDRHCNEDDHDEALGILSSALAPTAADTTGDESNA